MAYLTPLWVLAARGVRVGEDGGEMDAAGHQGAGDVGDFDVGCVLEFGGWEGVAEGRRGGFPGDGWGDERREVVQNVRDDLSLMETEKGQRDEASWMSWTSSLRFNNVGRVLVVGKRSKRLLVGEHEAQHTQCQP